MILKANKQYEITYRITPSVDTPFTIALPDEPVDMGMIMVKEPQFEDPYERPFTLDFKYGGQFLNINVETYKNYIPLQQHNVYRCRINIRPEYKGHKAKEEIFALNGQEINMYCAWKMDETERYPNEYAMTPYPTHDKRLLDVHTSWIASGDLIILEEL